MKKVVLSFCLVLLLSGCASLSVTEIVARSRKDLAKIEVGMPRDRAMSIMGNSIVDAVCSSADSSASKRMRIASPYRTEILQVGGRKLEVLYYVIDVDDDCEIGENKLMPLVFENKILIGWGKLFLDPLRRS